MHRKQGCPSVTTSDTTISLSRKSPPLTFALSLTSFRRKSNNACPGISVDEWGDVYVVVSGINAGVLDDGSQAGVEDGVGMFMGVPDPDDDQGKVWVIGVTVGTG